MPTATNKLTNDEKHQLLLDSCKAVVLMAERIVRMAQGYSTFIRGGDHDGESYGLNLALDVLHPYVATLFDSEEGLGDPGKDREWIYSVLQRLRSSEAGRNEPL